MEYQYIKDFKDYIITKDGDVFSTKTQKYLVQNEDKDGYLQVNLYKNGEIKTCKIHCLVSEAFIENTNNCKIIEHIDGNKLNNNFKNLRFVFESSIDDDETDIIFDNI